MTAAVEAPHAYRHDLPRRAAGQDGGNAVTLTEQLVGTASLPGATAVPLDWPPEGVLLDWLRRLTAPALYTTGNEELAARRWFAGDPYGLRVLPAPPPFLAGRDVRALPAGQVAPLLRRLSMTRSAPDPTELTAAALAVQAGPLSVAERDPRSRRWGQPPESGAPPLPDMTEIPRLVHGIWLGRPIPETSVFWRNYGDLADRYQGRVDVVLWTDLPRERLTTGPGRRLRDWARAHGVHLVNVHEVFHAAAPMTLHAAYTNEMCKQLPRGYAAASDLLRIEIVHRFGGMYADGDLGFGSGLEELIDRVAGCPHGFTFSLKQDGSVFSDMIIAPARHPAIALYRELTRLRYFLDQPALFGGIRRMAGAFAQTDRQEERYVTTPRTGRMHIATLRLVGMHRGHLVSGHPVVREGREMSWLPPTPGADPTMRHLGDQMLPVLQRTVTFLRWQLLARNGDLYLTAAAPVIRGLPDPDTAWVALLRALAELTSDVAPVRSVTDLRRNDDLTLHPVELPPTARCLITRPGHDAWIGAVLTSGDTAWLLEERTRRAGLRAAGR
ncbi:TcdA/TcdB catalytic glycosyltransferase domain-containing protein [Solwaraspora sp. WMMB335]|uniref:TcdA/TcdB catalytic glycosyltransferase domain-containing protein n=1 Tax=Solwaraspora sp. WMMB335 TaxID=3404118 RepID=UPI003B94EB01